jgi:serine phosphatase RsbU (regulator of sigma subunit)/ligand-binding sensor domain-containing protein
MSKLVAFLFIQILILNNSFVAQVTNFGSLPYKNYSQKDYNANPQIFDIVQDQKGLMYFANQRGVLEYDGVNWRTIETRHIEEARCIELLENGSLIIGTTAGFGIIKPNDKNKLTYHSLSENLNQYANTEISDIVEYKGHILLKSGGNGIFVLDQDLKIIKHIKYDKPRSFSKVGGFIYFQVIEKGIMVYDGKIFTALPNSAFFDDKRVVTFYNIQNVLHILTENHGIFQYKNGEYVAVFEDDDDTFVSSTLINDNMISLGSFTNGIKVYDFNFNKTYCLDIEKGLMDGFIKCQFFDREGHLWLGTNNGISKIDVLSPILKFENVFKKISIEDIIRYNNDLVISSQSGVYRFTQDFEIKKFNEINADAYGLNVLPFGMDTLLFISELSAVYSSYKDYRLTSIANGGPYNVRSNPLNPNQLIVLNYDGIQLLEYNAASKSFKELNYIQNFAEGDLFNFIISKNGTIWIGSNKDGVYKINVSELTKSEPNIVRYFTSNGLPESQAYLFELNEIIYAGTDKGLLKFEGDHFNISDDFGKDFSQSKQGIHRISLDPEGNVWMILFNDEDNTFEIGYSKLKDGKYEWNSSEFSAHTDYIIHAVYHDFNGVTWLGGNDGLIRYDSKFNVKEHKPYTALIRSILNGDSTVYFGSGIVPQTLIFDYTPKKPIEFSFATNSFITEEKIKYSYYLEGFDAGWSEWSNKTSKEYSLSEGVYVFHVKAKNIYGIESSVQMVSFEVLPPWYRTLWAYIVFFILGIIILFIIIRLSLRQVKLQNIKLEAIVQERTQEVVAQKAEVEKQRDIAEHQKDLIEEKNTEILDSINYARRLQRAILPPFKMVTELLPQSFIYYKPKDIVAGDFYWLETSSFQNLETNCTNQIILLAAADCTGHGVPGALVSVVCSNAMNRAVKEFQLTKPNQILDKVRDLVIETFEKSESEVKDGMDISLASLYASICKDTGNTITHIDWSGANNPLWIIRKGATEIDEIKPDKQPIGKYENPKPFNCHHFELTEGDTFYIFTDGFPDQFGGPKGKKFMYKAFKDLLLENNHLPMNEQLDRIKAIFHKWKHWPSENGEIIDYEQIDDVCIIGVRL